jgi:hypothetical protein
MRGPKNVCASSGSELPDGTADRRQVVSLIELSVAVKVPSAATETEDWNVV